MNHDHPLVPRRPISFRTVCLLVVISAASLVFCFAWYTSLSKITSPSAGPSQAELTRSVKQLGLTYTLGAMGVWIAEELIFRGYLLQKLRRRLPLAVAVLLSSFLFGLLHAFKGLPHVLLASLMGVYFAWLMIKTGSVFAPIVAHVAYNVTGFYIFLPLSGISELAANGVVPDASLAFLPWYGYVLAAAAIAVCVPLLLREFNRTSVSVHSTCVAPPATTDASVPAA